MFVVAGLLLTAGLSSLAAQQQQIRTPKQTPFPKNPDWSKLEVESLHVQGQVYLIAGAGGNIAAQVGDESMLLVDTGYEQMAPRFSRRFGSFQTSRFAPSSIRR